MLLALLLVACPSCRRGPIPGADDLPPGIPTATGSFVDHAPRWSHDGRRIAFLRSTPDRRTQLCIAPADLSRVDAVSKPELISPDRAFRAGRAGFSVPDEIAWSPNDEAIAVPRVEWFTFDDGERMPGTGLWEYRLMTGAVRPLALHPKKYEDVLYYFRSPQWSPDGKRIAFIGEGPYGDSALFVRTLAGSTAAGATRRFDDYDDVGWPVWSPDGSRLAFRQGILRAMTADTVETVRMISPGQRDADRLFALPSGSDWTIAGPRRQTSRVAGLAWSQDGKRIAFSAASDPLDSGSYSLWYAVVERPQSLHRITSGDGGGYFAPVWIDEQTVGALRRVGKEFQAVAISIGEGATRTLCRLPSDDMDWSPDRRWIVCAPPEKAKPAARTTLRVFRTGYRE